MQNVYFELHTRFDMRREMQGGGRDRRGGERSLPPHVPGTEGKLHSAF